ncbi:MAG: DNA-protecting protein DprA [Gammaproteobacteria bacterium]|nr:DNA-protecting protein DprA [Gammaproteobacteria bacterium]MYK47707.1 DNA-protecting protein DprA [Gammaproteobacteria bacterium]
MFRASIVQYPPDNPDIALSRRDLPLALRSIPDPPLRIYCRGDPGALDRPAVAIVGSRRCTRQGREMAFALAHGLAARGVSVVSGLAYGIDAAAHRGALAALREAFVPEASRRAATIAVLGSGLDNIYPRSHTGLAAEIVAAGGALLSEHEPHEGPRKHHFPARNRIVSGLCLGVVIVEASDKSGSLITARMALEQGRDVMAVPSLVSSPLSAGCHRLIRQGAALVETTEHVLEALGLEWTEHEERAAAPTDAVFEAVGATVTSLDEIIAVTGIGLEAALERLMELQIDGLVAEHGGGYIRRPGRAVDPVQ